MCCFTLPVEHVKNTRIFARSSGPTHQFLVYEMNFSADDDLALLLPIPVAQPAADNAVRFINLEKYPAFFKVMAKGFPAETGGLGGGAASGSFGAKSKPLKVEKVGSFEASFVPTIKDFARLDERFRLPPAIWEQLPQYRTYGFAVFKLKKDVTATHPMAFEFPRQDQTRLFFPTIHIHDGEVHDTARFDHTLYAQFSEGLLDGFEHWTESMQPAGMFMNGARCKGLIDEDAHAYRREIRGVHKNADILV